MPPWTSFDDALLVPEAKSPLSMRATRRPRRAASRATPAPVMPPPRTSRSKVPSASDSSDLLMRAPTPSPLHPPGQGLQALPALAVGPGEAPGVDVPPPQVIQHH